MQTWDPEPSDPSREASKRDSTAFLALSDSPLPLAEPLNGETEVSGIGGLAPGQTIATARSRPVSLLPVDSQLRHGALITLAAPLLLIIPLLFAVHSFGSSPSRGISGWIDSHLPWRLGKVFGGRSRDFGSPGFNPGYPVYPSYPAYPTATDLYSGPSSSTESSPAVPDSPADTSTPTAPSTAEGPALIVEDYFAAINSGNYQTAWNLGGDNLGESYDSFVSGFADTDRDDVVIESVSGNVVTASLTALNNDQTTHTFFGTYTVTDGAITHFAVQQTG